MAVEIFIHKMSDHMETAKIIKWLVEEGEHVEEYQLIMEVETDKAIVELESPATGILKNIRPGVAVGAEIPVGVVIAYIAGPDEEVPVLSPFEENNVESISQSELEQTKTTDTAISDKIESVPVLATPIARRVAKDLGVDINQLIGSGPGGRIREQDVRDSVEKTNSTPPNSKSSNEIELVELTSYQKLTGQRMLESVHAAPQFPLNISVDMANVLSLREALMEQILTETGSRLSVTAILVKITAEVLKLVPRANATFENGQLKLFKTINIGLAIGSDIGLVVPVINDADKKSLVEIVRDIKTFKEKSNKKHFKTEDLSGGTFTLSNLGMYGIDHFNAIINPPQSAILAVGSINKIPVVLDNDEIAVRPITIFTLTVDHRCLDGLQGAKFLDEFKKKLQNPNILNNT